MLLCATWWKKNSKLRLLSWVLLSQEFDFEVKDRNGGQNQVAKHLSILHDKENEEQEIYINDVFSNKQVSMVALKQPLMYTEFVNYIV